MNKKLVNPMQPVDFLKGILGTLLAQLKARPNEDRLEIDLYGYDIKVWKTRINCTTKYHIGYKARWEKEYRESRVDIMAERIYVDYASQMAKKELRPLYAYMGGYPEKPDFSWEKVGEGYGSTLKEVALSAAQRDKEFRRFVNLENLTYYACQLSLADGSREW